MTTKEDRFDQLSMKGFNPKNPNIYRGLFPTEKGKLSWKEGYDMGSNKFTDLASNDNPFYGATPKLHFPGNKRLDNDAKEFYKVTSL